jgi:hypothetical protein
MNIPPVLTGASIPDGTLIMCGNYIAVINGPKGHLVGGAMYPVKNKDEEDALRHYETEKYEVVQCLVIPTGGELIEGLMFRYCGCAKGLKNLGIPS